MSKAFTYGLATGLAVLIVAGVSASRRYQRNPQEEDRAQIAKYQKEIVDATEVQFGVLTEQQRIHSKTYAHYRQLMGNKTITWLVSQAKDHNRIVETVVNVGFGPALTEPQTPEDYFGELARASDAVIRGKVTKKVSQITEDDGFLFTDYDVVVIEVLKNNVAAPINVGATVSVTRPGGKVVLDGVVVKARDDSFAPLPIGNHETVLFLKFIQETGTYGATRATGSFEIDGSALHPLTGVPFPPNVLRDRDSFLQTLRSASN